MAGYTGKVVIGMDVAASEFCSERDKTYDLNFKEDRVAMAISKKTCNALLLKLNQIGSHTLLQRERRKTSNGVRVPLQQLRRLQGEEAAAQERAAQAAESQDPGKPRGALHRQEQVAQLREISKAISS